MNLLEGAVGVTSDALREEAATGNQWFACFTGNQAADIAISSLFGAGGIAILGASVHFLKQQYHVSHAVLSEADDMMLGYWKVELYDAQEMTRLGIGNAALHKQNISRATAQINKINAKVNVSTTTVVFSSIGVVVGLASNGFYDIPAIKNFVNSWFVKKTE
jgi:hypothetical protein